MSASKIFLYLCLSFIFGIFVASFVNLPPAVYAVLFIFGLIFLYLRRESPKYLILGLCVLILCAGVFSYKLRIKKIENLLPEKKIEFTGIITREPDVRIDKVNLIVKNKRIGKVLVTSDLPNKFDYGDKLKIKGKIKIPNVYPYFNYRGYLAKDGIYYVMYYPKIVLLEKDKGNFIYKEILHFKNKLRESIKKFISSPYNLILGAIILGDKRRIPQEWKNKLNITGLRHITAISGMHIIILSEILMLVLIWIGLYRSQAFYFTVIFIFLFVIMIGFPASAVRAGIMGFLLLFAQKIGRLRSATRALVFSGAIMLGANPLLLKYDIGFQLSFLAVLGIIYLCPIFSVLFKRIPNFKIFPLRSIMSMTLSAQVFTLPVLVYNFGYISYISIVSNILIVSILPYIMGFGIAFSLFGIISNFLGWLVSFPCWILLVYMVKIIDIFSKLPFSWQKDIHISWILIPFAYAIIFYITWFLNKKYKEQILLSDNILL